MIESVVKSVVAEVVAEAVVESVVACVEGRFVPSFFFFFFFGDIASFIVGTCLSSLDWGTSRGVVAPSSSIAPGGAFDTQDDIVASNL